MKTLQSIIRYTGVPLSSIGLCISSLKEQKEQMKFFVADSDEHHAKRIVSLSSVPVYQRCLDRLDKFDIYILDKLETVFQRPRVLDTHQYADTPEIEAFLQRFELSLLRLRPASDWRENDIGTLQRGVSEVIPDEMRLQSLLAQVDVDLKMLHYQYPGFEHYDVLSTKDGVVGMQESKRNVIAKAMRHTSLLGHVVDGNVRDFRLNALMCVGIEPDAALSEEESVDHDSNASKSQHSSASSEEEASSSSVSDSDVESSPAGYDEMCLPPEDKDQTRLPPDVPTPFFPRCRGNRLCGGYNMKTHCPDGVQSGLPPGVPIPSYPRRQEIIFPHSVGYLVII